MKDVVKVLKLKEEAMLPTYGSQNACGADLYACIEEDVIIKPGETVFVGTGIALSIPDLYGGFIYARSGLSCKKGLAPANKVGVIDSDYRGEIIVALYNQSSEDRIVKNKDRIAQLVVAPYVKVEYNLVDTIEETNRGDGGFGSTGGM